MTFPCIQNMHLSHPPSLQIPLPTPPSVQVFNIFANFMIFYFHIRSFSPTGSYLREAQHVFLCALACILIYLFLANTLRGVHQASIKHHRSELIWNIFATFGSHWILIYTIWLKHKTIPYNVTFQCMLVLCNIKREKACISPQICHSLMIAAF